jgi:hypothetical protein
MGAQDIPVLGYPKNLVRGSDFDYSPGCGGMGAGFCYLPASFSYIWWRIFATNFVVKNRKLVLQNIDFKSYLNAGSDGICPNSEGASQPYDIVLSYAADPLDFTPENEACRITIPGDQTMPFEVEFNSLQIPQPDDPRWNGIFTVMIDLKTTGRMVGGVAQTAIVMSTVDYDYDERL